MRRTTVALLLVLSWSASALAQDGGLLDLGASASPIRDLDAGANPDIGPPDAALPSPAARARSLCVDAVESFEAGRPRTALNKLKAAVRLSPNQFGVIVNLADYYKLMGPRESAITYYRRARDLNPRDLSVAGNLIDLLLTQNPPQNDLDTVQRIVKFTLIDIQKRIDETKTEQQRFQRQRKTRKLLKANNTLRELNVHMRSFLRREIRWAMRARAHNEVSRIYEVLSRMGLIQDLDDLALELGDYYRQIHQETNAVQWYQRVQRSTKLIRKAKKAIAEIEHQQSVREMGLVGRPNRLSDADAGRLSYGRELLSQAQDLRSIRNAVTVLQEIAGKKPLLWQVHRLLGRAYTSLGEAALAEQALLTAVALNPTGRDTLMSLAEFYETKQRWKSASTYFGRVLRLVPTDAKLQLRQSKVLEKAGWYSDALLQVNRALDVVPEDHPLEPSLQDQKIHLEGLAKPIANKPETTADRVQATAQAFFRAEQFGQAVKEARKIPHEERRPELWLLLGRSEWRRAVKYERRDQMKRARFAIERANKALVNIPSANNETYCESRRLLAHLRERQQKPNAAIELLKLAQGVPACGRLGLELELVRLELLVQVRPELPDWISDLLDFLPMGNLLALIVNADRRYRKAASRLG